MDATALVLVVLFCSTFIRATFGFGDALVAMPLLAMVVGLKTATPLVALVASTRSGASEKSIPVTSRKAFSAARG